FDFEAMLAVTITGQLMLVDLVERLGEAGARALSVNTDGLGFKARRGDDRWRGAVAAWGAHTGGAAELDHLPPFVMIGTNHSRALHRSGRVRRQGGGLRGELGPANMPNELVVGDAVAAALLRDAPPERTIRDCTDPVRFAHVTTRSGAVAEATLVDRADGSE